MPPTGLRSMRRCALATEDVEAAAGHDDRHHERDDGQADVVGYRHRHDEGEHADEMHRPYSASHRDRGRHQPYAAREAAGDPRVSAEIEGGVRGEGGDEGGENDEIRIMRSRDER